MCFLCGCNVKGSKIIGICIIIVLFKVEGGEEEVKVLIILNDLWFWVYIFKDRMLEVKLKGFEN